MIKVGDIITCPHCGAVLEVEKSDLYNLTVGLPLTQIYIKCPNCGKDAYTEGVFDTMDLFW